MSQTPKLKRIYDRTYAAKPGNQIKLRCREQCAYAIKAGKLVRQPCEKCGLVKSEAHHEDYSKPFDVKWLCRKCHAGVHRGEYRSSLFASKTHCPQGHEYAGANVGINGGKRYCRQCHRNHSSAYKRRQHEQAATT